MKLFEAFVAEAKIIDKDTKKTYNNLTDVEKHIIREYESYKKEKSTAPVAHNMAMLDKWRKRAVDAGIDHLLKESLDEKFPFVKYCKEVGIDPSKFKKENPHDFNKWREKYGKLSVIDFEQSYGFLDAMTDDYEKIKLS